MNESKTITGLIVGVRENNGVVLFVEQDDGESTCLPFDAEQWKAAFNGSPPANVETLPGHRINYDGTNITFLDTENAKPLFCLGRIVATPGGLTALTLSNQTPAPFLLRHAAGDWGVVCDEDKEANQDALRSGDRLLSAYLLANGKKLWIITEAVGDDGRREATTLLLPEEY